MTCGGLNGSWEAPTLLQRLSDGQEMKLWQEEAACGGAQAPRFRAEFVIDAPPREAAWNNKRRDLLSSPRVVEKTGKTFLLLRTRNPWPMSKLITQN